MYLILDKQLNKCLILMLTLDMNSGGKIIQALSKETLNRLAENQVGTCNPNTCSQNPMWLHRTRHIFTQLASHCLDVTDRQNWANTFTLAQHLQLLPPKHQGIGKNYLSAGNAAGVALGSLQENTRSAKDYFLLTLFFSKKEVSFLHPKMLLLLSDYRIHRREKDSCKTVESGGYLERTRHIRTFISEINQPSNY